MQNNRPFERIDTIFLDRVTKRYGSVAAVENLSLEIDGGELICLIGGSGSGKTTTLRMCNRLIEPDSGRVLINGADLKTIDPVRLRRHTGYVIQSIGLFPHMTVGENIGLIPHREGWDEERVKKRVSELLRLVALPPETFLSRYPRELSGGQQQRVGLARALAMDPPLLLMDEPFGALDPLLRHQLQDEFLKIKQVIGRTILFVTHDLEEAFRLGDRVAVLDQGRLVQVGTPDELLFSPVNAAVANLFGSGAKYRHLDRLTVRDLMSRVLVLDGGVSAGNAAILLDQRQSSIAAIVSDGVAQGVIERDGLTAGEQAISTLATDVPMVAASDGAEATIRMLRDLAAPFALVMEHDHPVGILNPAEALLSLV
ncbi:ABC transporter ATP-binding protein [Methanosphaerula palustris]|uniref:Molybdate/tungstate import ATP-binding protein WtpC n=1 Tax=Methanosphaerula palustris (strain ATCC BAA-1556 / DSM 19958 / E1-9c) TaxID=521011 RepID=B8GHU5_METPE|nr:betaine/proline/choline family ABC transporter ATP-binding protein [Methanosphaerula palustris]ACL16685.1 glycine betaine/L-proline ABC transporter, ATPase subunit [Methanosphaerula palustris E1-9c]